MLEIIDHGVVREVRLARPPVNALSRHLVEALDEALRVAEGLARDPLRLRAVVLSGLPGVFSAGLDIREVVDSDESVRTLVLAFRALQERLVRSPFPVVVAITGQCPAGAAVLAILCDHRIMARGDFHMGYSEVKVALYPGQRLYRCLTRVVGGTQAASMLTRGLMLGSEQALACGLVDELTAPDQVIVRALELAHELAALPLQAYQKTRALVRAELIDIFEAPMESPEHASVTGWVTDETRALIQRARAARD